MKKSTLLCYCLLGFVSSLFSQSGPNDSTFNLTDGIYGNGTGFDVGVNSLIIQPDGKILAGGTFTAYNGIAEINQVARIHANGYIDSSFSTGSGFNNVIKSLALQADGKIVAGGNFTEFNGITGIRRIIRLNSDGSMDQSFNTGTGFDAAVNCVALQADGKILAAGHFTFFNGTAGLGRIARLNTDGSIDSSFNTGNGFNGHILSMTIQPDGKLVVGGSFTAFDTLPGINNIARLNVDGTLDTAFSAGTGFNSHVYSLALQADGKIVVGGQFTAYNGISGFNRIARLNADGTLDQSFDTGTGFNEVISVLNVQTDGKIIAGGGFTFFNETWNLNDLVRLNPDGTMDPTFNTGNGFEGGPGAVVFQADGKLIVGGLNTTAFGLEGVFLRLNTNGTIDPTFNTKTGFNNLVRSIVVQPDGNILVGGNFTSFNGIAGIRYITRINPNGSADTSFHSGTGFNNLVYSIALQPDGNILVGGNFTSYNGIPGVNYIARLHPDGTLDSSFHTGTGFSSGVTSIILQADGKILVGGSFISFNGMTGIRNLTRLNANGTIDTSFHTGSGFNHVISCLALQADGKIIAGGQFTSFNTTPAINRIVRLHVDGSLDASFTTGTGFNASVGTLAIQPDGKILVGGSFTSFHTTTGINYLTRLNPDGMIDSSFQTGTGFNSSVSSLLIQPDGKIIVTGNFTTFNGITRNHIVRLHPIGFPDPSFTTGTGFDDFVMSSAMQADGKILAGGNFTEFNGIWRNRIVRLLNYNNVASGVDTQVHCGPFTWINGVTYSSSNYTATHTLPNAAANGNDSLVSLNLTITNINNAVSVNGITLTAGQTAASYQWIDCNNANAPILGATARIFTPTMNGSYAVKITLNGCTKISGCIAVTTVGTEHFSPGKWSIYPNPAKDELFVEVPKSTSIRLIDIYGKVLQTVFLNSGKNAIELAELTPGIYFIAGDSESIKRFVKQ